MGGVSRRGVLRLFLGERGTNPGPERGEGGTEDNRHSGRRSEKNKYTEKQFPDSSFHLGNIIWEVSARTGVHAYSYDGVDRDPVMQPGGPRQSMCIIDSIWDPSTCNIRFCSRSPLGEHLGGARMPPVRFTSSNSPYLACYATQPVQVT